MSFEPSKIFRIVNLVVGGLSIAGGISQFFPISFQSAVIAIFVILFGVAIVGLEFKNPSALVYPYASFLYSFLGRGVFYVFIGCIILHDHVLRIIVGSIIAGIGVIYVIINFTPRLGDDKPESMRQENDYEQQGDIV